jgi:glycine cleavage system H protein
MSAIRYAKSHVWLSIEGDVATLGISPYAQEQLGDVVYVELPKPGHALAAGTEAAVVESVKTASEIELPVAGTVIEANAALEATPALVNEDPLGKGWLFKLRLADPNEAAALLDQAAYDAWVAELG